jgi:hypothetical protein
MTEGDWAGPLLITVMVGVLVHDSITQISEVAISGDLLAIQRGIRTKTYAICDITSVDLALRPIGKGNQYLDVVIEVNGKRVPIRPAGSDPFQLFAALESAVARPTVPSSRSAISSRRLDRGR